MMGLLLSLIVAVAAFNIITSLGLMVMEKQGEVAILQTQGLTPRQIMMVFMVQGASAGIIGAILGAALGALLASQLNNLMPIIGVLLDGCGAAGGYRTFTGHCYCAGGDGYRAAVYALPFMARCRHSTR